MTAYQFQQLPELKQLFYLWRKGVYLTKLKTKEFKYILYQLDGFYVEEKRHARWNFRYSHRSFDDTASLKPYLNKIDISQLFPANKTLN